MATPVYLCLLICIWSTYLKECPAVTITTAPYFSYQPLSPYGIHIRNRDWITFQLKTRENAHLGLQSYYNRTDAMYEVVLGALDNSYSVIRNRTLGSNQVILFGSVVSEEEYRHFWVSWTGGTITVGRGTDLGSDVIMSWTDPSPLHVGYLAVSSWPEVSAEWIWETPPCKEHLKFAILQKNAIFTPSDSRLITANDVTSSCAACTISCFSKPWCRGFSYGSSGNECNMFDVAPQIEHLEESEGWETWSLDQ